MNFPLTKKVAIQPGVKPVVDYILERAPQLLQKKTDQFIAALAHEIRNPLSTINLATEMLKPANTKEDKKIYLDIIQRNSLRIGEAVTDLLNYLQADEMRFQKQSICQLLEEVIEMVEDRILLKKIIVKKHYTAGNSLIFVNKQKLKIALTNIIINAIEAMPPEKGQLNLSTRSISGKAVIEIGDNGTGISKENLKQIFDPYFTKKPGGMGLGLSTTLDILQSNHAHIAVQSKEKKGTRFILSFKSIPVTASNGLSRISA